MIDALCCVVMIVAIQGPTTIYYMLGFRRDDEEKVGKKKDKNSRNQIFATQFLY